MIPPIAKPDPAQGASHVLSPDEVLEFVPQREPFRFIDSILELDSEHIVSDYRYRTDHDFYAGHFPGNPITPGVILVETMAQSGVVALGLYLLALTAGRAALDDFVAMFTDVQAEFSGVVRPGERVTVEARKQFFRRHKIRSQVEMRNEAGRIVCSGVCAGMAVPR